MPAERTVRQLRVRAPDEALARRARLVLEDALRTASLPGQGAAVVLVRRLRLPPFRETAAPQSVALALEAYCRSLTILPVVASTPENELAVATAVRFRDPLQVRLELGARVVNGVRPHAWCWPLAVPGFRAGLDVGEALRVIALSIAALPEADAALPLWLNDVVIRGAAPRLLGGLSASDAASLVAAMPSVARVSALRAADGAGNTVPPGSDMQQEASALQHNLPAGWSQALRWASRYLEPSDARWRLLAACAHSILRMPASAAAARLAMMTMRRSTHVHPAPTRSGRAAVDGRTLATDVRHPADLPATADEVDLVRPTSAAALMDDLSGPGADAPRRAATERTGMARDVAAMHAPGGRSAPDTLHRPTQARPDGAAAAERTAAAGLLFLLGVLESLRLPDWLADDETWSGVELPARIFRCTLSRLRIPSDDPAWWLADFDSMRPLPAASVGQWQRLARGGARPPAGRDIVVMWLSACRRWLRTQARIGVADLVCRPGSIALTATHVDIWIPIEQTDLRIRRAGLDLDPGWVPWLGRVVRFHYGDAEP